MPKTLHSMVLVFFSSLHEALRFGRGDGAKLRPSPALANTAEIKRGVTMDLFSISKEVLAVDVSRMSWRRVTCVIFCGLAVSCLSGPCNGTYEERSWDTHTGQSSEPSHRMQTPIVEFPALRLGDLVRKNKIDASDFLSPGSLLPATPDRHHSSG